MGTTDSPTTLVEVPQEDGAIAAALTNLDTKLTAWSKAMALAHDALRQATRQADSMPVPVARPITARAPEAETPASAPATGGVEPADKVKPPDSAKPKRQSGNDKNQEKPAAPARGSIAAPSPASGAPPAAVTNDEDEALLATLDPKTAKAIRIKRRLCNGKKSVRELLEEG